MPRTGQSCNRWRAPLLNGNLKVNVDQTRTMIIADDEEKEKTVEK